MTVCRLWRGWTTPARVQDEAVAMIQRVRKAAPEAACLLMGPFARAAADTLKPRTETVSINDAVRAAALFAMPVVVAQPQSTSVLEGQSATFVVSAAGADPISYQWRRNGTILVGATAPAYTTPAVTIAADNGATYSVVITNALGSTTSTAATLAVAAVPAPAPPSSPLAPTSDSGGGAVPLWQLLLLSSLLLAARVRGAARVR